jgi:hypothetical protein
VPENIAELQSTIMPPDAPTEGEYTKLSNHFGKKPLMILRSKYSIFVSCKQTIEH